MNMNKTRPLPYQYKTNVLYAVITAWCIRNGYSSPKPHRIVHSILPRLTELDLTAIENDRHPLWVSDKKLKDLSRTIYTMPSNTDKVVASILDQCGKKKDICEVDWDDVIAPRRFSPELLESAFGGNVVLLDTGPNSVHLRSVNLEDMVDIQKFTSYLWTYLGSPEAIMVNEDSVATTYVADYRFGDVMSGHLDILLGNETPSDSPMEYLIDLMKDQLSRIIPHWDTLKITRIYSEDEFVGIRVEVVFASNGIPLLMADLCHSVYRESAHVN